MNYSRPTRDTCERASGEKTRVREANWYKPPETLGDHIRRIRTELGLGLRETARKIGISATFLSRVETNAENGTPSEDVLRKIATLLADDLDILMHLADRVPRDVASVIKNDPWMPAFLRTARDHKLSGEQLLKMLNAFKKKGRRRLCTQTGSRQGRAP
jgi:transcriptional regulator with XRE-family HTH domain